MKCLIGLFSFLLGKYKSLIQPQANFLTEGIILKIRKMVFLFSLLVPAGLGLSLTLIKFIEEIGVQFENGNGFYISGHLAASAFGLVLFAVVFVYALDRKQWTESDSQKASLKSQQSLGSPSPLEVALAALVTDFVEERKLHRTQNDHERKHVQNNESLSSPLNGVAASK